MDWMNQLREEIGDDVVFTDPTTRLAYSFDATPNYQAMPDAIVAPRSTEHVQAVLRLCHIHRIPVVPVGRRRTSPVGRRHSPVVSSWTSGI